jgi:hypothetical protein
MSCGLLALPHEKWGVGWLGRRLCDAPVGRGRRAGASQSLRPSHPGSIANSAVGELFSEEPTARCNAPRERTQSRPRARNEPTARCNAPTKQTQSRPRPRNEPTARCNASTNRPVTRCGYLARPHENGEPGPLESTGSIDQLSPPCEGGVRGGGHGVTRRLAPVSYRVVRNVASSKETVSATPTPLTPPSQGGESSRCSAVLSEEANSKPVRETNPRQDVTPRQIEPNLALVRETNPRQDVTPRQIEPNLALVRETNPRQDVTPRQIDQSRDAATSPYPMKMGNQVHWRAPGRSIYFPPLRRGGKLALLSRLFRGSQSADLSQMEIRVLGTP